jgi:hypothetical protein
MLVDLSRSSYSFGWAALTLPLITSVSTSASLPPELIDLNWLGLWYRHTFFFFCRVSYSHSPACEVNFILKTHKQVASRTIKQSSHRQQPGQIRTAGFWPPMAPSSLPTRTFCASHSFQLLGSKQAGNIN